MPPKISELIAELEKSGFVDHGGKGNHRKFVSADKRIRVTLSGKAGSDAKPYQEKMVARAIRDAQS